MMPRNSKPVILDRTELTNFMYKVKLEKIFGVTLSSPSALATDPNHGVIAYPAGCTVVLYHPQTKHQSFIVNTSKKCITALAFSSCGRYLVTGETGHQPAVRVWDLDPFQEGLSGRYPNPQQIARFLGHKFGVGCVAFSPSDKIIVSVGSQHDMIVNVWDWKNDIKVASNKVSTKVRAIAFAENGSYFVTVGNRLVKFWYFDCGRNKYNKEAVPLMGRSAILGEQRNNNFVDVACGKAEWGDNTYAITRSGVLCEFNNRRLLAKWVLLNTGSANSISVGEKYIFVGCDNGIVRCFEPLNLNYVTTLPRTHYLGVDVSLGLNISHLSTPPPNAKYPDVIALSFDEINNKVTCVYNDHSIYIWDVFNIHRVGKADSFLFHSACIWGVEMAPANCPLPTGSFLTCSSDDTIRVWTLNRFDEKSYKGMYSANIYSRELLKVIYADPEMKFLKDKGSSQEGSKENASCDSPNGVRTIKLSHDGKQLASGDRIGNVCIHETTNMTQLLQIEAHNNEVLSLAFSKPDSSGRRLLASASRDRLIHVFDVNRDFTFLQTLDDHSSSITSVRFLNSSHGNLQLISCGADKSLIFRSLAGTPNGTPQFQRSHNATGKNTLYDMEVDPAEKHVLTACQDRNVRVYNVVTGKHTRSFKGSMSDEGSLIKVALDISGSYLATSTTDKTLNVYDCYTGDCMAMISGHSELATGLRFTNDCKRIISTSGDGCIFVWRVPYEMVVDMHERHNQNVIRAGIQTKAELFSENDCESDDDLLNVTVIRKMYKSKQLPGWAKKKMRNNKPSEDPTPLEKIPMQPKGRWAERAAAMGDGNNIYSYFADLDSSLESERDVSQSSINGVNEEVAKESQTLDNSLNQVQANTSSLRKTTDPDVESTAHDADVDSDQDYRQQAVYYPTTVDSALGSEFTVNNIDTDELRKSVRRSKRNSLKPLQLATTSAPLSSTGTGSQESDDDDDDEASTPSGENTDANPMSMLSTSMESLYVPQKERNLNSNYESLSGNELESSPSGVNASSISAQYHTKRLGLRNVAVVNAARQTKNDVETIKKREQLHKMIADTKKKLQSFGYVSPLKASQSICDLSQVPEKETRRDRLRTTGNDDFTKSVSLLDSDFTNTNNNHQVNQLNKNAHENHLPTANSSSVPNDLQLCGCYMREIQRNLNYPTTSSCSLSINIPPSTKLSDILSRSPEKHDQDLAMWLEPRKLQLDKTLHKNKLYKSLPVSPVSEECKTFEFEDFDDNHPNSNLNIPQPKKENRKSFSYFLDLDKKQQKDNDSDFKQICDDIEKFSQDFSRNYQAIEDIFNGSGTSTNLFVNSGSGFQQSTLSNEDKTSQWLSAQFGNSQENNNDGNFSSDSLEDCSFNSMRPCKKKHQKSNLQPPRRCVSNNELYNLTQESNLDYDKYLNHEQKLLMPKSHSQSFYLNQSAYNSQESILSSEDNLLDRRTRSFCNSMESILSNESDCKSAPLECLFKDYDSMRRSKSCNYTLDQQQSQIRSPKFSKTVQTQTDFETPEEIVVKKSKSTEFQQRLLRFEQKKPPVAYFLETSKDKLECKKQPKEKMEIPTMQFKNAQYKSKYCNVLNNKPEQQQQFTEKQQFALTTHNLPNSTNNNMNVNLTSRKNKNKLQETASLDRHLLSKGLLESEKIYHKPPKAVRRHSSKTRRRSASRTTYEYVKKEDLNKVNLENSPPTTITTTTTSIEFSYKESNTEKDLEDVHLVTSEEILNGDEKRKQKQMALDYKKVQNALKNINVLNEIQEKISAINDLIDLFKKSLTVGKVKAMSSMFENLSKSNSGKLITAAKRNISMPDFSQLKFYHKNLNSESSDKKFFKDEYNKQQHIVREMCKQLENKIMKEDHNYLHDTTKISQKEEEELQEVEVQNTKGKDSPSLMESRIAAKVAGSDGSMRRACSLSDLSHQRIHDSSSTSSNNRSEGKYSTPKNAQIARLNSRQANGNLQASSPMMRSSSTSVLNRSDSDDGGTGTSRNSEKLASQSRLMRPTISSQNKVSNSKSSLRKRHSHSSLNLSPLAREDSSSEESEVPPPSIKKPIVPPRTRLPLNPSDNSPSHHRALWNKPKEENPNPSSDAIFDELKKLHNEVANNLTSTAREVVKLFDNLMYPQPDEPSMSEADRTSMGNTLTLSALSTVRILHEWILHVYKQNRTNPDVNLTDSVKKLNDLVVNGFPTGGAPLLNVMQQYLDIMLAMAQQNLDELNK